MRKGKPGAAPARVAAAWLAGIAMLPAHAQEESAPAVGHGKASFAIAVDDYRSDRQDKAMQALELLAEDGDARAQYLLGAALIEGRYVPQDRARGYALLETSTGGDPWVYFSHDTRASAQSLIAQIGPALPGADLIKADRISGELRARKNGAWAESFRQAAFTVTGVVPVSTDPLTFAGPTAIKPFDPASFGSGIALGCGSPTARQGCRADKRLSASANRCAGQLVPFDKPPRTYGPGVDIAKPYYAPGLRRSALEGRVALMAHVDRNGYVCFTTIVQTSGIPDMDQAALDAVRTWRVVPASMRGEPVEALFSVKLEFTLEGYQFDGRK